MSLIAENSMQIDVNNSAINNAVAVQGDHIGRKIKITLLSQGEVVDLSNCTATVKCSANGKTIAVNSCDINANVVTVELTKTMLAYSGKIKMQVSVTDSGGAVISTPIIYLIVSESISTTPVEQTPDFSILTDLTGRIMAVLNDPAVGDTEVKEARGGYTVLGDRLNGLDKFAAFPNHTDNLIKNHINFSDTIGWDTVNTGTLTAVSTLLRAVSETNLIIYGTLEKTIKLNASASILIKIRARCTSGGTATVKPVWRKTTNGVYVTSDYIAAGNIDTTSGSWTVDSAFTDMWLIAKDGSAATTINQVGIAISSGATVEIAHFEVYYSTDDIESTISALKSDVSQSQSDITALQSTVNGSASTSGTVKNQIAAAKSEIVEESVNPLAERVSAAENNITKLKNADNSFGQRIGVAETDITNLKTEIQKLSDSSITRGEVQSMIDNSLGVIENGTY